MALTKSERKISNTILTEEMCEGEYTESDIVTYGSDRILILFNRKTSAIKMVALGRWTFSHYWRFGAEPNFLSRLRETVMNDDYWRHKYLDDQNILRQFLSQQLQKEVKERVENGNNHVAHKLIITNIESKCDICKKDPDHDFDNARFFCTGCAQPLHIQSGQAYCKKCQYHFEFRTNGAVAIISVIYTEDSNSPSN